MIKQKYLKRFKDKKIKTEWIKLSMQNPSKYMTRMHLILHAIELKNRGELK